nr:hypothetical protein [Verrucomicrobiota bacterium]
MSAVTEFVMECPHCKQPIIFEQKRTGQESRCPHCYQTIPLLEGEPINKETYHEPKGLRRILREVRDREMEGFRRRLEESRRHAARLQQQLTDAQRALSHRPPPAEESAPALPATDATGRAEDLSETVRSLEARSKQQETALAELQLELEAVREEASALRQERSDLSAALQSAVEVRKALGARLAEARLEADGARQELTRVRTQLDAETAKALRMEAAGPGSPPAQISTGSEVELRQELAKLQKTNDALRGARDRAREDLDDMR